MSCTTHHFKDGHFDHVRVGGDHFADVTPPAAAWSRLYGPSVVDMVIAAMTASFSRVARWCAERRAIEHMQSLSDHQLRDLGIAHNQIAPVVLGLKSDITNDSLE